MLVKLSWWAVVALTGYVAAVLGLSTLMVRHAGQCTPAYVLWKYHAFPYVKRYVTAGLFYDSDGVLAQIEGRPIEAVQQRFGGRLKLVNQWEEAERGNPAVKHRMEAYVLDDGPSVEMIDGRCAQIYVGGG